MYFVSDFSFCLLYLILTSVLESDFSFCILYLSSLAPLASLAPPWYCDLIFVWCWCHIFVWCWCHIYLCVVLVSCFSLSFASDFSFCMLYLILASVLGSDFSFCILYLSSLAPLAPPLYCDLSFVWCWCVCLCGVGVVF